MKLYLVKAELLSSSYMSYHTSSRFVTRIVWATSIEEAEEKVRARLEVVDPYGKSTSVVSSEASEAIE